MKGYGIYVKNDLLEPKHIRAMGNALWEYLWCLDKITSINESGVGKILGGKPIKRKNISDDLGISERHISIHLKTLEQSGYINLLRTPYGFVITVNKSVKIFNNKNKEKLQKVTSREVTKSVKRSYKSGKSLTKKVTSNKTIQLDNTKTIQVVSKDTTEFGNSDINEIINYYKLKLELPSLDGTVKSNRYASQRLLVKAKGNVDAVKRLIDCLALDDFHVQNASSITYLDKHAVAIMSRARRNNKIGVVV